MTDAAKGSAQAAAATAPEQRPPQVVITRWTGDQAFDAGKPGAPTLRIDSHGREGPGPVETLLAALASCSATDVVEILAKRRTPVRTLEVETTGVRADTVPRKLEHVTMLFKIAGAGIERPHAERAIDLAVNKYCSVRDSLDPRIKVDWRLELSE